MSSNAGPLTAIERARVAYEEMKRRQHDAAAQRRARERTRNIGLALAVGGSVALFLGVVIYNGWLPDSLRSAAHEMQADRAAAAGAAAVDARTGQIKSFVRGNTCQELKFNNDSGTLVAGSLVPCEVEIQRDPSAPGGSRPPRLNFRDAFSR